MPSPNCMKGVKPYQHNNHSWWTANRRQLHFLPGFGHFLDTRKKKGLAVTRKSLIFNLILVGGAGFEPATPAV